MAACAGCIFLVDNSPGGDQFSDACAVAVPATTCGTCIDTACDTQLSACCGDGTCRNVLSAIDECSEGGSCVVDTSTTIEADLEECIAAQCPACQIAPASVYDAGVYCSQDLPQGWCSCSTESIFGQATTRCDATTFADGMCCADSAWPSAGNCTCATISCSSDDTGGCRCSFNLGLSSVSSCNQGLGPCCASSDQCTCNSTNSSSCDSFSSPVSDCDTPSAVACNVGQHVVSNCSAL